MLITICEYDSYQDAANYQANAGSNAVNDGMTTPRQRSLHQLGNSAITRILQNPIYARLVNVPAYSGVICVGETICGVSAKA